MAIQTSSAGIFIALPKADSNASSFYATCFSEQTKPG